MHRASLLAGFCLLAGLCHSQSVFLDEARFNALVRALREGVHVAMTADVPKVSRIAGLGIVYQPAFIAGEALQRGALTALEFELPAMAEIAVYAVYPPGRRPPAKVRAFVDFLAEHLAD